MYTQLLTRLHVGRAQNDIFDIYDIIDRMTSMTYPPKKIHKKVFKKISKIACTCRDGSFFEMFFFWTLNNDIAMAKLF